jgi:hypothetical protein
MDLQTDSEEAEREGKKRLRKLERELKEIRGELDRSEGQRHGNPDFYRSRSPGAASAMEEKYWRQTSIDKDGGTTPIVVEMNTETRLYASTPTTFGRPPAMTDSHTTSTSTLLNRRSTGTMGQSHPFHLDPISIPTPSPTTMSPIATSTSSPVLPSRTSPFQESQNQPTLVAQLLAKISELESTNESIAEDRIIMEERLERAHVEVENMRKKCEELEDELLFDNGRAAVEFSECRFASRLRIELTFNRDV